MSKKIWNTKGAESSYEIASFLAGEDIESVSYTHLRAHET